MPCRYEDDREIIRDQNKELDKLTRLLCEACNLIDQSHVIKSKELTQWWRQHQEFDKRRKKEEAREKVRENLKKVAISKLTPEERKLLGV